MTRRLIYLLGSVLFGLASGTSTAFADNLNNRQRRLSTHYLSSTNTGQELLRPFQSTDDYYNRFSIGDLWSPHPEKLFEIKASKQSVQFRLNGDLLAASPEYLSWVLAQALVQYRAVSVAQKFEADPMPYFIEFSQWELLISLKYWEEFGAPQDFDYADHPIENIRKVPQRLNASVNQWNNIWRNQSKDQFLMQTERRHLNLGYPNQSLVDFARTTTSDKNREAALILLDAFHRDLEKECQRRPRWCR